MSIGIVGVGEVGCRVHRIAETLGMTCVLHDPPLAETTGRSDLQRLDAVLDCDVITLHVPLTADGPHQTKRLVDADFLARMKKGAMLINTSRGPVVDSNALNAALTSEQLGGCVLDVWESEPEVDLELMDLVTLATPHIAGYAYDGKIRGTEMLYRDFCSFVGVEPKWDSSRLLPQTDSIMLDARTLNPVNVAVTAAYDILEDDARMRGLQVKSKDTRCVSFDALRKTYPMRREFASFSIEAPGAKGAVVEQLSALGFRTGQS